MVTHAGQNKWTTCPVVVYGPPGTGKTTWVLRDMAARLEQGICPDRIGFVSFTRSAVGEARQRAQAIVGDADLPYFRTLHSMGHRLLGRPPVVGAPDAKVMLQTWGYRVNLSAGAAANTPETEHLQRWALIRSMSRSMEEAEHRLTSEGRDVRLLIGRYEQLRRDEGRVDFVDMLMLGMEQEMPKLDVLYVDEAQDLSPLQIEFTERLAAAAAEVVVAGDDDQAIMRFQGATPEWLQSLSSFGRVHVLPQSYRIPASVHRMAEDVVRRVRHRVAKDYLPRDEEGCVRAADTVEQAIQYAAEALAAGQTAAYLGRTNGECSDAVEWALGCRVPYVAHAGVGSRPLQAPKVLAACEAALQIRARGSCTGLGLVALLDQVVAPARGSKAAAKRLPPDAPVSAAHAALMGLGGLWDAIRTSDGRFDALSAVPEHIRSYLDAVLLADGSVPRTVLEIGTQHWSKGQEWDLVVVDDMLPRPSVDALRGGGVDADDEHRIAYVAVTRARRELVVLSKPTRAKGAGQFAGRYPYPMPEVQ